MERKANKKGQSALDTKIKVLERNKLLKIALIKKSPLTYAPGIATYAQCFKIQKKIQFGPWAGEVAKARFIRSTILSAFA